MTIAESQSPEDLSQSEIYILAEQIRLAADFLISQHHYKLEHLRNLSGGGDKDGNGGVLEQRLHKNSVMKIKDLRTVRMIWNRRKKAFIEAADPNDMGHDGVPARTEWLWNPQADTFERLELILLEAIRLGFQPPKPYRRVKIRRYAADGSLKTPASHEADRILA